jgi:ABC-type multidrug transport system permease subunit
VATVVHDQPVTCTDVQFARIVPPLGQTCQQWIGPYITEAGGYLQDPTNSTLCLFCRFANGDEYVLSTICLRQMLMVGCFN